MKSCKCGMKKKVMKHLKEDVKSFKKEAGEDKALMKSLKHKAKPKAKSKAKSKIEKVMHEFKEHKLHSGSKKGPIVTNPKQGIAIALSEARRMNKKSK